MKIFISWSGELSRQLAEALSGWFKEVIQVLDVFFSPEEIEKGTRWASEIAGQLKDTDIGVLVLTPDNISAPWILFEAGALSKHADKSRVSPILFGLAPTDLTGPLAQFMATPFNKEEMLKLVMTIRERLADERITKDLVEKTFTRAWPDLETAAKKILADPRTPTQFVARKQHEVLDEILQLSRTIAREVSKETPSVKGKVAPPPSPNLMAQAILGIIYEEGGEVDWPTIVYSCRRYAPDDAILNAVHLLLKESLIERFLDSEGTVSFRVRQRGRPQSPADHASAGNSDSP